MGRTLRWAVGISALAMSRTNAQQPLSTLRFVPELPRPGQVVTVEYSAAPFLTGADTLVLRGTERRWREYIALAPAAPVHDITRLVRGTDGVFRGQFRLAATAEFLRVAVGTTDSALADGNTGRHWILLVAAADGRPAEAALASAVGDEAARNAWDESLRLAEQLTDLYPDSPVAWFMRAFAERAALGARGFDVRRAAIARELARLDSLVASPGFRDRSEPGTAAGVMMWFADSFADSARAARWRERLLREFPRHPLAVQERLYALSAAHGKDHRGMLASLDSVWDAVGPVSRMVASWGIGAAGRARDTSAVRRWIERANTNFAYTREDRSRVLIAAPGMRNEGMALLREELAALAANQDHRLDDVDGTLRNVMSSSRERASSLRLALARALLAAGDSVAALGEFQRATAAGWAPPVFRTIRDLALRTGDTVTAIRHAALVAVDPLTDPALRDSLRSGIPRLTQAEAWARAVASAREELANRIVTDSGLPFPAALRLAPWGGREPVARPLAPGRPTVIATWSWACPASAPMLPALKDMQDRLESLGVDMIVVTTEPPSSELARYVAARRAPRLLHDLENEVGRAASLYGFPWFVVVDGDGRMRLKTHDATLVPAFAVAMVRRPASVVAAP